MKKLLFMLGVILLFCISIYPASSASISDETKRSVVMIESYNENGDFVGGGTGAFISIDGLILTNAHVILDNDTESPAYELDIYTLNQYDQPVLTYVAEVWAYDSYYDLALITPAYEIDDEGYILDEYIGDNNVMTDHYVDLSDYNPSIGDEITILGFPETSFSSTITLTKGTVSGFTYISDYIPDFEEGWVWEIETDATINPGNSGGLAFNEDGKAIGVVTSVSETGIGGNYGYIISNDIVYFWFWELVDQDILLEDYVLNIFANDYDYEDFDTDSLSELEDYANDSAENIFTDVSSDDKYAEAISFLKDSDIIAGYPDGSYKPDNPLNRAELLKILVEGMGYSPDESIYKDCFPDVGSDWYAKYVCFAKENGWVVGYDDGFFRPTNYVNKAEAMKMLLETFKFYLYTPDVNPYNDVPADAWFASYIYSAKKLNLLEEKGYIYNPGNNITRGQVSENLYRLILYTEAEVLSYIDAMIESTCATEGFEIEDKEMVRDIFDSYGFPDTSDDALTYLFGKYEDSEYVLDEIMTGIESQCPEYIPEE